MATCTTAALAVGAGQTITATYSGDGNNVTSNDTVSQTVNAATSGTTVSSSVNPSHVGQSVTFTATVTGSNPTGTSGLHGRGHHRLCHPTRSTARMATCTTTALPAGADQTITATYSGDGNNATSTGTVSQTVNNITTTSLGSSANPSIAGNPVTYTATVAPAPDGGTVAFTDNGTTITGCEAQPWTAGVGDLRQTYTSAASHNILAVYSGDTLFTASTSPPWPRSWSNWSPRRR